MKPRIEGTSEFILGMEIKGTAEFRNPDGSLSAALEIVPATEQQYARLKELGVSKSIPVTIIFDSGKLEISFTLKK